jgi:imidazolonepropionase-like amidohydrolase
LSALRIANDFKLKIVIQGGVEGWKVAAELAKAKVPVAISPPDNLPSSFDAIHVRDDNAKLLAEAGVSVVIVSDGAADVRRLRQSAGIAVSRGLPWEKAFAAVTQAPAEMLGAKNRGTLAVGNAADVVVWSGDPLELSSRALHVFCNGTEQSLENHQSKLLQRYRTVR